MEGNSLFLILMVLYIGVTVYFGARQAKKQDTGTVADWYVAGGKVAWAGVGITIAAAWLDMATVFLNTGGAWEVGISAFWYLAGAEVIAFLLCAFVFAKKIRGTKMISQGEMLEKRFGSIIRPFYSAIWVLSLSGYAALSFLVFQETFNHFFGLSPIVSAIICLAIVLAYQLVGGFAAVVYADYIQGALIIVGTAVLGIFSVSNAGGLSNIVANVPPDFLSPVGIGVKEVLLLLLALVPAFVVEPTLWMRVIAAKDLNHARKGSLFAFFIYIPVCAFTLVAGLSAHVLYKTWDGSPDLIAVKMAQDFFPTAITAFVLVAIMAALISSFSAFMFAANMSLTYDLIPDLFKRFKNEDFPENKYRLYSRVGLVFIGVLATAISILMPTLLDILLFAGTLAGAGMFWPIMGMFFSKKVNTLGAVLSFALGSGSALLMLIFGAPWGLEPIVIAFPLSFIGLVVGTMVGKPPTEKQLESFETE